MTPSLLMLLPFGVVVGVGFLFVTLALRRKSELNHLRMPEAEEALRLSKEFGNPEEPVWVQLPNRWMVVHQVKAAAVRNALGLHGVHWCTLSDGLQMASQNRYFISLPIREWVFVFGSEIPDPSVDPDFLFRFLSDMSRELGTVQFFSCDPVLGHHAWAWLESGQVKRAFAWNGTTLWNQGRMTPEERQLKLECPDYFESGANPGSAMDSIQQNSDKVTALAARWGVGPNRLTQRLASGAQGIVGKRRSPRGARP